MISSSLPCEGRDECLRMARPLGPVAPPAGAHLYRPFFTLPACLRLYHSPPRGLGVFAAAPLPSGLYLGPYWGRPVRADNGYSWHVRRGRLVGVGDENWMRFINCTLDATRQNLAGFQHRGALYYRTVAPLAAGDELLVYYGDDYVGSDDYYNYVPPMKEPEAELAVTSDGDSDTDPGNDCARNIGIDANDNCDYGWPKEEPESKFIDIVYDPLKEEPEVEFAATDGGASYDYTSIDHDYYGTPKKGLGSGDGDADNDYGPLHTDGYFDDKDRELKVGDVSYRPFKEEPEPELSVGDQDAVDVNYYYDYIPPKEEPKSELTSTDSADDCYYDGDPLKEEPKLVPMGDDAVADGSRDVGYDCSHCGVNLCAQKLKVEHETRCMKQKRFESQVTKLGHRRSPFRNKEYEEQHQQKWCGKKPVKTMKDSNDTHFESKYVTKLKDSLERHVLNHNKSNAEWLTCTQCSYKTVHKRDMIVHMKIHGNTSMCCPLCGRSFKRKQGLDDHLLRQHSDESDEVSELIMRKVYTCNICNKFRTIKKTDFNIHLTITHHKGVGCHKYECLRCPYSTFRKTDLRKHSQTHGEQKDY